jgi:hypothetical protein
MISRFIASKELIMVTGVTTPSTSTTQPNQTVTESVATKKASDFSKFFEDILGKKSSKEVSEEELFSLSVKKQLTDLKGDSVAKEYQSLLDASKTRSDGRMQYETGAKTALAGLVSSGKLTGAEADKIFSQSFTASQLDSQTDSLWDDTGSATDPTKAVMAADLAITKISAALADIANGKLSVKSMGLSSSPTAVGASSSGTSSSSSSSNGSKPIGSETVIAVNGNTIDGEGGFLFKPVSINEGKVAILMPTQWKNNIDTVWLLDKEGKQLDVGYSTGYGETGERQKFRFNQPGSEYPKDIQVKIKFNDGSFKTLNIADPSKRYD